MIEKIWEIRAFVYDHFKETTHPPSVDDTAARFDLSNEEAVSAYEELNQRHAFFLEPGTHNILMASPFSAIETPSKYTRAVKLILPIAHGTHSASPPRCILMQRSKRPVPKTDSRFD